MKNIWLYVVAIFVFPLSLSAAPIGKVLIVLSSESELQLKNDKKYPTGFYFNELILPAMKLKEAGYDLVVANPKGNPAVMDKRSDQITYFNNDQELYTKAKNFMESLETLKKPMSFAQVLEKGLDQYAALFVPGGHAPLVDLTKNADLGKILQHFHEKSKPTALLCHGPVALASAAHLGEGWIYRNYKMTVFSTKEERVAEKTLGGPVEIYPEKILQTPGGKVLTGDEWKSFVVRDRELITGQNPASEAALSVALLNALKEDQMAAAAPALDPELKNYKYPFPVQQFKLTSQNQDLQMSYMDLPAEGQKKSTILLLHGKNFGGFYFEEMIKNLTKRGYRVLVPDQIGFGKSSKPASYQFSFQALAENTKALLDELGVTETEVLGHSMGGMLAMRFSLMFPGQVKKLHLVNPIGLEDWKTMTSYRGIDQGYKAELATSPQKIRAYQQESYYDGEWRPEYQRLIEVAIGWSKSKEYPRLAWNSALTSDMVFTQPVFYEMKNIKVPTVLIIGQRDRTAIGRAWAPAEVRPKMGDYPALGRNAKKMIKKSVLVELKGLGHVPFIEAPDQFWKAVDKHFRP